MIEVIAAASHQRLATVAALKAELGISGTDKDTALEAVLDRVSAAIATYCGRVFAREQVRETLVHRITPREILLSRYPVVSLDSVTLDDATVEVSDYTLDKDVGHIFAGTLGTAGSRIVLTYTAGYVLPEDEDANLPDDIQQAALTAAKSLYRSSDRDPTLKAEETEGVGRLEYFVGGSRSVSYFVDVIPLIERYRTPEAR
jgi:uncharacterized phiE125 gp8 family phage protein